MSPAEGNFDRKGSLRGGRRRREGSGAVDQGQTFGIEIGFAARPQQNNRRHASGSIENKPNRSDPFDALKCALGKCFTCSAEGNLPVKASGGNMRGNT